MAGVVPGQQVNFLAYLGTLGDGAVRAGNEGCLSKLSKWRAPKAHNKLLDKPFRLSSSVLDI
jgi:hypothetical protein